MSQTSQRAQSQPYRNIMMKRNSSKEYYYKYIRQENKKYIQNQRKLTIEGSNFIEYDRHNKEGFKQKVQSYILQFDHEEEQLNTKEKEKPKRTETGKIDEG